MKLDFDPRKNVTKCDHLLAPFTQFEALLAIKRIVKNWPDVLLFRLGLKKKFILQLRDGSKINVNKLKDYFNFWNSEDYFNFWNTYEGETIFQKQQRDLNLKLDIDKRKKIIKFNFMHKPISLAYDSIRQLVNTFGMITEQFVKEEYKWLCVKDRDVVDIGANIGDTAIYFALKGARHVYAFEPYPYSYNVAVKNVKLNHLEKSITLLNEGVGGKCGSVVINDKYQNTSGSTLRSFRSGKHIGITTLGSIINRFKISYPAILKIDCEGCEYSVLLKAKDSDLKRFKQIQIEYHHGYLNLKKKLEDSGFKVKRTLPRESGPGAENSSLIGLIYAERS